MAFHLNTVLYRFLSLLLLNMLNSLKRIVLSLCFWLVPFRGKILLKPHPDWYLLGVHLKFPDEHPRPLYMGVPPPEMHQSICVRTTVYWVHFWERFHFAAVSPKALSVLVWTEDLSTSKRTGLQTKTSECTVDRATIFSEVVSYNSIQVLSNSNCSKKQRRVRSPLSIVYIAEVTHDPRKRTTMVNNTGLTSPWDFSYRGISGHT